MKVPKYIRDAMHKVARHSQLADIHMREVECWLEMRGVDLSTDGLRDGGGCSLEELEYGLDIVDDLCERIESMSREEGGLMAVSKTSTLMADNLKPCSFCAKWDWGEASAVAENKRFPHVHLAAGSYRFPPPDQFNFCPVCGRENPNKPWNQREGAE